LSKEGFLVQVDLHRHFFRPKTKKYVVGWLLRLIKEDKLLGNWHLMLLRGGTEPRS